VKFINLLQQVNKVTDIFSLISQEYLRLISDKNIEDNSLFLKPIFVKNLDLLKKQNLNEEQSVSFEEYEVIFYFTFISNQDTLKISYRLNHKDHKNADNKNSSKLLTLMSIISINDYFDLNQISIKTCSMEKNIKYNVCYIENFRRRIMEKSGNLREINLKINMKICYLHSELSNYVIKTFMDNYSLKAISKTPKQFLGIVIRVMNNRQVNDNYLAIALLNWCNYFYNNLFSK